MTTPDTKAILAQMEALAGFIPGPWELEDGFDVTAPDGVESLWYVANITSKCGSPKDCSCENARLIAAAPDMRETILAICDALDAAQAESERLQTIIGNLHTVEGKHRETANAHFHRANRLRAESDLLRRAAGVVSAVLQSERTRSGGQPFTGNWSIPQIGFRGTVDDALDMADAALAQKGGE